MAVAVVCKLTEKKYYKIKIYICRAAGIVVLNYVFLAAKQMKATTGLLTKDERSKVPLSSVICETVCE